MTWAYTLSNKEKLREGADAAIVVMHSAPSEGAALAKDFSDYIDLICTGHIHKFQIERYNDILVTIACAGADYASGAAWVGDVVATKHTVMSAVRLTFDEAGKVVKSEGELLHFSPENLAPESAFLP